LKNETIPSNHQLKTRSTRHTFRYWCNMYMSYVYIHTHIYSRLINHNSIQ
jgi:hypothetical protein